MTTQRLQSERIVIQSPTSFVGSTRRLWAITNYDVGPVLKWLVMVPLALMVIAAAWTLVVGWYFLFGIFVIPYRLLRRGQRRRKQETMRHRELLAR